MSQKLTQVAAYLPTPWSNLSYAEIMNRSGGQLIQGGRSSRVFRFIDDHEICFLKRYNYRKIHWHHCWQKSQVQREFENLKKIKQANLSCETIEILAYGEQRRWGRILTDAFLLSRAVADGESLAFYLGTKPFHPQRRTILNKLFQLSREIIKSRLAITDLFFRNLVVVPPKATLFMLDVQYCNHNRRRAHYKSYPQLWSNILLFCTPEEQKLAAKIIEPSLPFTMEKLNHRAQQFIGKERKRQMAELNLFR